MKTARGIYFTNCFTIGNYQNSPTAMLPILSRLFNKLSSKTTCQYQLFRINHSCCPNSEFHWDTKSQTEHLRAIRDIEVKMIKAMN